MIFFTRLILAALLCWAIPASADPLKRYQGVIDSYNAGTADAYFGAFAESFCFHNKAGFTPDALRATRGKHFKDPLRPSLNVSHLEVLSQTESDALIWEVGAINQLPHSKLVRLRRQGAEWKIVVEVSPHRHGCDKNILDGLTKKQKYLVETTTRLIRDYKKSLKSGEALSFTAYPCFNGADAQMDGMSDHEYDPETGEIEEYSRWEEEVCMLPGGDEPFGPMVHRQDSGDAYEDTYTVHHGDREVVSLTSPPYPHK